jgi:hypothetical protein
MQPGATRGHNLLLRAYQIAHARDLCVGGPLRSKGSGLRLEYGANLQRIADGGATASQMLDQRYAQRSFGRSADDRATSLVALDDAAGLKNAQSLPNRGAANAKMGGKIPLRRQSIAGSDLPRQDILLQLPDNLLVEPGLEYLPWRRHRHYSQIKVR